MLSSLLSFFLYVAAQFSSNTPARSAYSQPEQPLTGPGGRGYHHDEVIQYNFASQPDGYWLFEPAMPTPATAPVVVFIHGYGGYNPMIYGAWIRHLVRKGNVVIYPRYQKNMLSPSPEHFAGNVAVAIRNALQELKKPGHVSVNMEGFSYVGHSYGGVVAADLAVNHDKYQVPVPESMFLCAPGSGKFKGGRLDDYSGMPGGIKLLMVVNENDWVVGDEFAVKLFEECKHLQYCNLLRQRGDDYGSPAIQAHHNQTYALDSAFDSGVRNYTSKRALKIGRTDAVDYYCYWKLCDALLNFTRTGLNEQVAFGGTPEQLYMGQWSDGTLVEPLEFVGRN